MRKALRTAALLLIVGVAVAVVFAWPRYRADIAAHHARLAGTETPIVQTPFGGLQYALSGDGAPALVIHGSGGGFDQGLEMVAPLADRGFKLIAPSRFGYLGSPFPRDLTVEQQADAFVALLDHLAIDKVAVFGGSAGALSAMQIAIRHPERCKALVLMVPASYAPDRKPNERAFEGRVGEFLMRAVLGSDIVFWVAAKLAPDALTEMLLATKPNLLVQAASEEQARVRRVLWNILPISRRRDGLMFDMKTAGAPPRYDLARITCPVLTISAQDDLYGTAAAATYTASAVRDGRVLLFESGGHILVGRGQQVWPEVAAFLRLAERR